MDEAPLTLLNRIYAAVNHISDLEGQDPTLVIEMSQAMLNDVIEHGVLDPMVDYVKMFCDVIDGPDDAQSIADDI